MTIDQMIDLDRFPLDRLDSPAGQSLVARCKADLVAKGMFNLDGLVNTEAIARALQETKPVLDTNAFVHKREHNIYFKKEMPGLAADHPALRTVTTINHTICADQLAPDAVVRQIYHWPAMAAFLAATMDKPVLYTMPDPLACLNVMAYRDGDALNWHFDRSEFTTTLLLQAPKAGGEFEYRTDLRSETNPNYDGVGRLIAGTDPDVKIEPLTAGTLNVFKGKNTAHRVTTIKGDRERIIAVLSFYERPGVMFSAEERLGFYGRAH
jgi:hypothetical protein